MLEAAKTGTILDVRQSLVNDESEEVPWGVLPRIEVYKMLILYQLEGPQDFTFSIHISSKRCFKKQQLIELFILVNVDWDVSAMLQFAIHDKIIDLITVDFSLVFYQDKNIHIWIQTVITPGPWAI